MKKLSTLFFALFLILSPIQSVHAAAFAATISGPTQITAGQQFTVNVGVANVTNMMGMSAEWAYDSSKLTLVSSTGQNGFTLTLGTKLVVDRLTGKSGNFTVASIVFKAKTTFTVGATAIVSINNSSYSNGVTDINDLNKRQLSIKMVSDNSYLKTLTVSSGTLNFSKTTLDYTVVVENSVSSISLGATPEYSKATVSGTGTKNLAVYSNYFNIVVTAENGSKRTYVVNVQRKDGNGLASPPSTNNNLKSLTISGFDAFNAGFDKATLTYVLEVGNLVTDLTITADPEDSKSAVVINKQTLVVGSNTITVVVTAENGDVKTYTITVNRSSDVPTVDEDEIIAALATVTTPTIGLNMPASGIISTEILSALKTSGKTLVIVYKSEGKTLYEWLIDGSKLTATDIINTLILFTSDLKPAIDELTNYAQGLVLDFEDNAVLPENTVVRLYVSDRFADGTKLTLYFYNEDDNRLSVTAKDLVVENGKVEFTLTHTSTYFLSPTQLKMVSMMDYVFVLVSIVEAFVIVALFILRRRPRKEKRDLSVN
jgi:hypothetical protein